MTKCLEILNKMFFRKQRIKIDKLSSRVLGLGFNSSGMDSVWNLHVLRMFVWIPSEYSGLLPRPKTCINWSFQIARMYECELDMKILNETWNKTRIKNRLASPQ